MNKQEAERILEHYRSTHEWSEYYYYAEFNIKVRNPNLPDRITDKQRAYIDSAFFDILHWELDYLIEEIKQDKFAPMEVFQAGRSGGWLVCKYDKPSNGWEAIRIAHAIRRIAKLVKITIEYVRSEEFWADLLEANFPPVEYYLRPTINLPDKTQWFIKCDQRDMQPYRCNTTIEPTFWDAFNCAVKNALEFGDTSIVVNWLT